MSRTYSLFQPTQILYSYRRLAFFFTVILLQGCVRVSKVLYMLSVGLLSLEVKVKDQVLLHVATSETMFL